jgi:hypothetical protein
LNDQWRKNLPEESLIDDANEPDVPASLNGMTELFPCDRGVEDINSTIEKPGSCHARKEACS